MSVLAIPLQVVLVTVLNVPASHFLFEFINLMLLAIMRCLAGPEVWVTRVLPLTVLLILVPHLWAIRSPIESISSSSRIVVLTPRLLIAWALILGPYSGLMVIGTIGAYEIVVTQVNLTISSSEL